MTIVFRPAGLYVTIQCFALGLLEPAFAQTAPPDNTNPGSTGPALEEIVVSATRREESLQKVPLAVTAISADSLAANGIQDLSQIGAGMVPGAIFQGFSGTNSALMIAIRGVSSGDIGQATQELAVPVYIDGVYLGRAQGLGINLIAPERVEVLRGPQGTLFGRNAEGGAVQYVSQKPSGKFGLDLTGSVGNFDERRMRGILDLPELGGLKIQLSGIIDNQGPFTKNEPENSLPSGSVGGVPRNQEDFGGHSSHGFRAAARWQPVSSFTADYTYDWTKLDDLQQYLTYTGPAIGGASQPTTNYPHRTDRPVYQSTLFTGASGHALTLDWKASDAIELKSITSHRDASRSGYSGLGSAFNIAASFGLPPIDQAAIFSMASNENVYQNQSSEELQLLGTWDRLTLTTGAIYYRENIIDDQRPDFLTGPGLPLLGLGLSDFFPGALSAQNARTTSIGAFAQVTWKPPVLDDQLDVTGGIRFSDDSKKSLRTMGPGDPLGLTQIPLDIPADFQTKRGDPAFSIAYRVSDLANVYARYAQAYRAGGVSIRSINFDPYRAEVTKEVELGFKGQNAQHNLQLNAAVYQNKTHDPQLNVQESPTSINSTTTINAPLVYAVRGAELEMEYKPLDALTLGVNYAYLTTHDMLFVNPLAPAEGLVRYPPTFAPRNSGSVSTDYNSPLGFAVLEAHLDFAFSSGYLTSSPGTLASEHTPDQLSIVKQLNARFALADLQVAHSTVEVGIWGRNLLDRHDFTYTFQVPGDLVHSFNYLTDPLAFGVDVRMRF